MSVKSVASGDGHLGSGSFAAISVSQSGARPEDRGRRHFGNIRQRASGRWQARYRHRGVWNSAPTTFDTAAKARNWLTKQDAAIQEDRWAPPGKGRAAVPTLRTYAAAWLADRDLEQTPATTTPKSCGITSIRL